MPQFNPSEEKVATATFPVAPAGLECTAELWLASNGTKVATSGEIPFVATGADRAISLPITMPGVEGTYPVYLDVSSGGVLIQSFRAVEDVVILPVTANLLLNPGFEDAFEHWTAYSNYPGRAHWVPSDEHPYEGLKSAAFAASVGGRPVVCTLSQVVPWNDGYKGQTFQLSAMRGSYPAGTAHDIEGMLTFYIYDGVTYAQNAVYVSHREAYREQSVVMTLSPNANRLEVIFQIVPPRDFHGAAIYLDNAILEEV